MVTAADPSGFALKEAMELQIQKQKVNSSSVSSGKKGAYWPLNYYKEVLKFTQDQVDGIARNCDHLWDSKLGCHTYCYDVEGRENEDTETLSTSVTMKPKSPAVAPPAVPPMPKAAAPPSRPHCRPFTAAALPGYQIWGSFFSKSPSV